MAGEKTDGQVLVERLRDYLVPRLHGKTFEEAGFTYRETKDPIDGDRWVIPIRSMQTVLDEALMSVGLDPQVYHIETKTHIEYARWDKSPYENRDRFCLFEVTGLFSKMADPDVVYLSGPRPGVYQRVK
jgi:hypothetical protein